MEQKVPTLQEAAEKELGAIEAAEKPKDKTAEKPTEKKEEPHTPETGPLKSLRTYQGDIEEILGKTKGSLASVAIAEQKRKEERKEDVTAVVGPPDSKVEVHREVRNKSFIFIGLSLFLLSLVVVAIVYYEQPPADVVLPPAEVTLINYSSEQDIPLKTATRESLLSTMASERQTFKMAINSVLYIKITNDTSTQATLADVAPLLFPNMPPPLLRALGDKYMFGFYAFDTNEPFMILSVSDYPASYAGMLKWEGSIKNDLDGFFSRSQAATTSPAFEDEALRNKDLRILRNEKGETVLLYSFVDRNTLIVTTNEKIFTAVLGKYLINQTVHQ